jgi:hypothetical protein
LVLLGETLLFDGPASDTQWVRTLATQRGALGLMNPADKVKFDDALAKAKEGKPYV